MDICAYPYAYPFEYPQVLFECYPCFLDWELNLPVLHKGYSLEKLEKLLMQRMMQRNRTCALKILFFK